MLTSSSRTAAASLFGLMVLPACFSPTGSGAATTSGGPGSGSGEDTDAPATTSTSTSLPSTTSPTPVTSTDATTTGVTGTGLTSDTGSSVTTDPATSTTDPPSAECGNAIPELGEECDDGNADDTDDCLATCQLAACGDGFQQTGVEECDDGANNSDSGLCTLSCLKQFCGDLKVCPNCGEECDGAPGCVSCKFEARYVFVSSATYTASDLQGLEGADAHCMDLAANKPQLTGRTFIAWLSAADTDASKRLKGSDVDYRRLDGNKVADDITDLLDSTLDLPINIDDNKVLVDDQFPVWTGTQASGVKSSDRCGDWTTAASMGQVGRTGAADTTWTALGSIDCGEKARIYCFQVGLGE